MAGELEGRKLIVVRGTSGMGRAAAGQVVEGSGSLPEERGVRA